MTILIADAIADSAIARLQAEGHEVIVEPTLKGDALTQALAERQPEALVVRSTRVTAADLDAAPSLELIVRGGAGVDTIDVEGASRRGIFVANCPGKNAAAVAELAFGLILAIDRRIPDNVSDFRSGRWNKKGYSQAQGLKGRTLGLIGMGNIGHEMVPRAKAFGMPVVAWSRSLTDAEADELGIARAPSPEAVAAQADVLSVHVASTPQTRGLIGERVFAAMRPGAYLVNTSRADVVDADAMEQAIAERGIRIATDVPAGEPQAKEGPFEHPLQDEGAVYVTHHIGASTDQATEATGAEVARVLLTYAETGRVPNALNLAQQTPATHLLTVRHLDRVGVLAGVLDAARRASWNVQEMENLIFEGAEAACARIRFSGEPDLNTLAEINGQEDVLNATIIAL